MTRSCGACTMCCKSAGISEPETSAGSWCSYCTVGQGCAIYDQRPDECASFRCQWLQDETLGPQWRPDIAGFVLALDPVKDRLTVHLNSAMPDRWRQPAYRDGIVRMAQRHGSAVLELRGRVTPLR